MELIQLKLVADLKNHFKDKDKDIANSIAGLIERKVQERLIDIDLSQLSRNHFRDDFRNIDSSKRCDARLWNDHFEGRCKNRCKHDGLCLRHFNMSVNEDLEFGRVCDERPTKNRHGKYLTWYDGVSTIDGHINLLREENRKRIIQYIVHHMSNPDKS